MRIAGSKIHHKNREWGGYREPFFIGNRNGKVTVIYFDGTSEEMVWLKDFTIAKAKARHEQKVLNDRI